MEEGKKYMYINISSAQYKSNTHSLGQKRYNNNFL